jgi:cyclopropane-fatty-acyl-phospholipid synthase
MRKLVQSILGSLIRQGRLTVTWPNGATSVFSGTDGPQAAFRLRDAADVRRLALNPALAFGELYMSGGLQTVGCCIYDLLDVLMLNDSRDAEHPLLRLHQSLTKLTRRLQQFNDAARARRHVALHYDLDSRLYSLFLDADQQYSCGYFARGDETLEQAQLAKKRLVATKLRLDRPGLSVLDIGCGWGGLALTLAAEYGARVTGITLSTEQLELARARAAAAGLADRVRFELADYRDMRTRFDRVVSIGMFEHVGIANYGRFYEVVRRSLVPEGVALIHHIGRSRGPEATNAWLRKYIFPGGYSPALSEVMPGIEQSGLTVTDIEVLRLHYARTIALWRERFARHRDEILHLYDERFCRMFEFYLAAVELAFRHERHVVFQIQLSPSFTAVPLTRDYMLSPAPAQCVVA